MVIFGWIAVAVGTVLFLGALGMTVRANPRARIPFFRNSDVIPAASITMRSIGAGLLVFGAAALTTTDGYWALVIALAGPLLVVTMVVIHNATLDDRSSQRFT